MKTIDLSQSVFLTRRLLPAVFLLLGTFIMLRGAPLYADFMVLHNKKIMVGKFKESTDTAYLFDAGSGEREVAHGLVERLVIGYDGIPVCFQTRRSDTPNCKGTLFLLDRVRAVLGFQQPGKDEWYQIRMSLASLSFLRMKKATLDPALMPVIATGVQMRVNTGEDEVTVGELLRARGNMLELRLSDGTRRQIDRGDIESAEILLPGRQIDFIPEPPKRRGWWIFGALFTRFVHFARIA